MDIWNIRWSVSALAEVLGDKDVSKKKKHPSDENERVERRTPRFNRVDAEVFEEKRATKRAA